ncbi:TldD/PmbA family protein [Altericista sp. CCNU0014]|uniref:TldD/PmbA family protein n=1 Tax=Altericista sp. CCNU0014 TaxID=3082949 RepID=UPI0038504DE9
MQQFSETYKNYAVDLIRRYCDRVDFLAIRLEQSEAATILLRGTKVETLSEEFALGGQVRACHRGGWGFTSFNSINLLQERIEEAIAAAKWVGTSTTQLAAVDPIQISIPLQISGTNPREIPLSQKKALCSHYASVLRETSPDIATVSVRYLDSLQNVLYVTSEQTAIEQTWVDMEMRFAATARQDQCVQTGRETTGSRKAFEDLEGLENQVRQAALRAVDALDLPAVKGGTYPVVIDPVLTGLFVHEAFGHLSEADMTYENPELLEVMTMGKPFGPASLNIYDGAAIAGHRGSYGYDDEGVPATITPLIESGILVGRLHSRETAGRLGEQPTGNARCLNYHFPPIVRMSNTWIERGTTSVSDLFTDIKEGIYARNWLSGMTNGEMFTFSAGEAWMIRNGRLAEPVRDVTLSGNAFKTLKHIEAIGDDFGWDESGGCGKAEQVGLSVGCGGPSLRIRNVVVSGEASSE